MAKTQRVPAGSLRLREVTMWRRLVLAVGLVLVVSSSSDADWQYTKWGMTPAEVLAASNGAARAATDEEKIGGRLRPTGEEPTLVARWKSDQFELKVRFYFSKEERLDGIHLLLVAGNPEALLANLKAKYGKAFLSFEGDFLVHVVWHAGKDKISYLALGKDVIGISYQPLAGGEGSRDQGRDAADGGRRDAATSRTFGHGVRGLAS
jgi:hypothetical protein